MIYRTTYQLCTILLITGMGLMHWKTTISSRQLLANKENTTQLLEENNKQLQSNIDQLSERLKGQVKIYYHYERLSSELEALEYLIEKYNASLKTTSTSSLNNSIIHLNQAIEKHILKIKRHRNLGIKPYEITQLLKHQIPYQNETSTPNFLNKDIPIEIQVLTTKNKSLLYLRAIAKYLCSKVGHTATFFHKKSLFSEPKQQVVALGDTFQTEIFPAETTIFPSRVKSVTVNGKPINSREFSEKPTTRGEHNYQVELTLINHRTGKMETLKKTFSYYVK